VKFFHDPQALLEYVISGVLLLTSLQNAKTVKNFREVKEH
jgi:hypothetical protein